LDIDYNFVVDLDTDCNSEAFVVDFEEDTDYNFEEDIDYNFVVEYSFEIDLTCGGY